VAAKNIHMTLAFLGEAEPAAAIAAARRVEGERFELALDTARYWRHNQIVWVGPRETPAPLAALAERLQLELFRDGFMLERRPFAAHVTLLRRAAPSGALPALPSLSWPVEAFVLVRSDRDHEGARYVVMERFPL